MNVGDLYIADCPYIDRPGSKERLVIILNVLEDGVAVLESRSKVNERHELILEIDFDRRYSKVRNAGHRGVSRFYADNVKVIPLSAFNLKSGKQIRLGAVEPKDMLQISTRLGFPTIQLEQGEL